MIQAIRRHQARRRDAQAGFTLIELLVVIIILGILAAVVVFAVTGVGDKGRASARAIDIRTIKTAQEAFCANFGRYADSQELVTARLLSEPPVYHQTGTAVPGGQGTLGNCGGAGDLARAGYVVTCDAAQAGCGADGALKLGWKVQTSGTTQSFNDVAFVDARNGWAVGFNSTVRHTEDGGDTPWTIQTLPLPGTTILRAIDCVDADRCWIVGNDGRIVATTNGGATWADQTSNTPFHLFDVDFVDRNVGWAVGFCGVILGTTNGGGTWLEQQAPDCGPPLPNLLAVEFVDANRGVAAGNDDDGDSATPGRHVYTTCNGGAAGTCADGSPGGWIQRDGTSPGINVQDLSFVSATEGWAVGIGDSGGPDPSNVFKTTDGGLTWVPRFTGAGDRIAVDFVTSKQGWIGGITSSSAPGRIQATTDGGATFTIQDPPGTPTAANGIDMVDIAHGWSVGGSGRIFRFGPV